MVFYIKLFKVYKAKVCTDGLLMKEAYPFYFLMKVDKGKSEFAKLNLDGMNLHVKSSSLELQ